MLLKSFVSLALAAEVDREIGMAALRCKISDKIDESPLSDNFDVFELIWVKTIFRGRMGIGHFIISL